MENQEPEFYVLPAEIVNGMLTNLSEQKLKDALSLYVGIQQNIKTLDAVLNEHKGDTE